MTQDGETSYRDDDDSYGDDSYGDDSYRDDSYDDDSHDDDAPLRRPARYRWVVWVMVAMLFVGPAFTLISVFKLAPLLVVTVAAFGIAAIYFVRASQNPPDGKS